MNIWSMPSVTREPTIRLLRWRIYRFTLDDRHWDVLSGWDRQNCCGRCSTPVVEFSPAERVVRTRSGRLYLLDGASGFDDDARYVFEARFGAGVPDGWQQDDVTPEYSKQLPLEQPDLHLP